VGWTLSLKNIQHHRNKTVYGICVLTSGVLEVVRTQRVKGPKGERVTIN
jgi:hypothetical protein